MACKLGFFQQTESLQYGLTRFLCLCLSAKSMQHCLSSVVQHLDEGVSGITNGIQLHTTEPFRSSQSVVTCVHIPSLHVLTQDARSFHCYSYFDSLLRLFPTKSWFSEKIAE